MLWCVTMLFKYSVKRLICQACVFDANRILEFLDPETELFRIKSEVPHFAQVVGCVA